MWRAGGAAGGQAGRRAEPEELEPSSSREIRWVGQWQKPGRQGAGAGPETSDANVQSRNRRTPARSQGPQ